MDSIWEYIRKFSVFMFMFTLNARFLYYVNTGNTMDVLQVFYIVFALLSFDFRAITKEYIIAVSLILLVGVFGRSSYIVNILVIFLLMQSAYFINIRTYLKYNVIILGTSAILMYMFFGIGENVFLDYDLLDRSERFDFGYGHPNQAAYYYYGLFISIILYVANDINYRRFLPVCLIAMALLIHYIYGYTSSRSFILSVLVFIIVSSYYYLRRKKNPDYTIGVSKYILLALPIIFFLLTIYYGTNAEEYPLLDILFSGRLSFYSEVLSSMTFINYLVGISTDKDLIIDSFYMHLLIEMGILLLFYFLWLYYHAMKNIIKQQNVFLIASIVSILCYGLMESVMLYSTAIGINIIWVLIFKYRYDTEPFFDDVVEKAEIEK